MLKKTTGAFDRVKTDSQNSLPLWQAVSCLNVICIAVKTDFRFVYVLVIHMFIISFKEQVIWWILPFLHVLYDTSVVLMSLDSSLEFIEEVSKLHTYHKTCHAQEYIAP